jgi:hypothetical protein
MDTNIITNIVNQIPSLQLTTDWANNVVMALTPVIVWTINWILKTQFGQKVKNLLPTFAPLFGFLTGLVTELMTKTSGNLVFYVILGCVATWLQEFGKRFTKKDDANQTN